MNNQKGYQPSDVHDCLIMANDWDTYLPTSEQRKYKYLMIILSKISSNIDVNVLNDLFDCAILSWAL